MSVIQKDYKTLTEEYTRAVESLQHHCRHIKLSEWMEEWYRVGASSGRKVRVCLRCNKHFYQGKTFWEDVGLHHATHSTKTKKSSDSGTVVGSSQKKKQKV